MNCLTIIVGKNASETGEVIVAHNEDDYGKQIVNLYKVSSKTHSIGELINFNNGGKIPQIERTNGFIWVQLPGMKVSDTYLNDKGVLITSNGCPSIEDSPDSTNGGILYWMRRIIAQRAQSAKEGVKLAGNLIEEFGYVSSGRSYTIADKNEAWVLAAVYGKHWVAQRVPDDQVAVIPNYYTIREINLSDTINFLGSSDIITYAEKKGWYNPEYKFDFAKVYTARSSINHPGNINRIWRGINLLSSESVTLDNNYPFSFIPFKKININDIFNVIQDHYELTEIDDSKLYSEGNPHFKNNATICAETTQYSFVAVLGEINPIEISSIMWFSYFRPCVNLYAPIFFAIESFPAGYAHTNSDNAIQTHFNPKPEIFEYNASLAYWNSVDFSNFINEDFYNRFPQNKNEKSILQNELIIETARFKKQIEKQYRENPEEALKSADQYSKEKLKIVKNFTDRKVK